MSDWARSGGFANVFGAEKPRAGACGIFAPCVFGILVCALAIACACAVSGCAGGGADGSGASGEGAQAGAGFTEITAEEAHDMMVSDRTVILDVRTQEEYDEGHIVNARLLSVDEITAETAAEVAPEKDAPVLVYCRTGIRAETACQTLVTLGYTQVYDFGGIVDWPYEVIAPEGEGDAADEASAPLNAGALSGCAKRAFNAANA